MWRNCAKHGWSYAALDVEVLVQLFGVFNRIQPELELAPGGAS
ncbi:MAG TPA: hypothetical protein VN253_06590 [Kofleriaceae bacterium]|nr:hypothetical protein [Kofleriaceae bacterium]